MNVGAEQLSCQEVVELVTSYLEGAMDELDRARFEAHIAKCEGCGRYVDQIRATIRLTGTVEPDDLSPEAQRKLLDAFRDWKPM
jgi:predicted anti-sigma-YlaC factor YlaD